MNDTFPEDLCLFIEKTVPTTDAAELLMALFREPARLWKAEEILKATRPTFIAEAETKRYLDLFKSQGLVEENPDGCYQYIPASAAIGAAVSAFADAYNKRPVTLIRLIYSRKIQAFAHAFRIRKD